MLDKRCHILFNNSITKRLFPMVTIKFKIGVIKELYKRGLLGQEEYKMLLTYYEKETEDKRNDTH